VNTELEDGAAGWHDPPAPSLSPRVELEARLLASEPVADTPRSLDDETASYRRMVIVVAASHDTRYYVRECLRARPDIRVAEAQSIASAEKLAMGPYPVLLVVDAVEADLSTTIPAIVLADEQPPGTTTTDVTPGSGRVWLARPFNAESLVALVDKLLGKR
jgi:hypothetical protein